ncbi:MAG TPA: sn-glycerol-3-phosphate ABC transporter ATP-binding protein UgpC [Longimicrobiales bacterium]|nr:sn-glycerol-3-phosphate ABC transporter ATP-binding protein UgpC [Longimicrobiales bacterium]
MARVRLEGVRKVYENGFVAVHDASFEIGDGEFVVLVGPSGCGKSTTLRMIAGLESVSAGRLLIGERVVNDVPPKDRDIAMVFQNYALYPHMSVRENLAFGLKLRKLPKAEIDARVRRAAEVLELAAILDRRPSQLSGGQRQRVAVGRALVREPQVFLFDEPLSNLDAKLRVQMRREISGLHRRLGATMVYVTHDQTEAMTMGDRIVVMNAGHVQQIGTPMELYERPANLFVAGFIGSPAMNLVRGRLVSDGGLRFRAAGDAVDLPIPGARAAALEPFAGRDVVLGVRPEAIYVAGGAYVPAGAARLGARLEMVEPLGNETLLEARVDGQALVARVEPQPLPAIGAPIDLAVDAARLHFFDPASERAIPRPQPVLPGHPAAP